NHRPRIARSASTTRPIPRASRAHGARWLLTEARDAFPPRPFVLLAHYTSTITGRITGFRCVTS
ncbi:MAG TPA: hypothetical protein VF028_14035, partial [Actinomycetota bacterium]|nr:hypothetical protein [Actinomycetota bacterium]